MRNKTCATIGCTKMSGLFVFCSKCIGVAQPTQVNYKPLQMVDTSKQHNFLREMFKKELDEPWITITLPDGFESNPETEKWLKELNEKVNKEAKKIYREEMSRIFGDFGGVQ